MKFLVKPKLYTETDSISIRPTVNDTVEVLEAVLQIDNMEEMCTVSTNYNQVKGRIIVGLYSIIKDENGGYDINNPNSLKRVAIKKIEDFEFKYLNISEIQLQQIFAGLLFGDSNTKSEIVKKLVTSFGFELV